MRICSFLPSATEIVYELGLQDQLFGVTHECDYPAGKTTCGLEHTLHLSITFPGERVNPAAHPIGAGPGLGPGVGRVSDPRGFGERI